MVRSSLTVFAGLTSAFALTGCAGQTVEGLWSGPFPLEGSKTCVIRLQNDRNFNVACDGTAIVAGGRYQWDGRTLTMTSAVLTYDGKVMQTKPEFAFSLEGRGNTMTLRRNRQSYTWKRAYR